MSNSPLVNYTRISPYKTVNRNHAIDTLTIHYMAGNATVEGCGQTFQTRECCSNYGIGSDGRVGMYCEEKDRSWCSSSGANDHRAITIEVANDNVGCEGHVSDAAFAKLIDLCVDVCQRNNIKRINYTGDKSGNLTMHCWFAATPCPGPYLKAKFPEIANLINDRLNAPAAKKSIDEIAKEVIAGKWGNGQTRINKLAAAGYDYSTVQARVNEILHVKTAPPKPVVQPAPKPAAPAKKSIDEIAKEVIAGKWGNGETRKKRLTAAGYVYSVVQKKVNALLKK